MIKKWRRTLIGGIVIAILTVVGLYNPTNARDVLYFQMTGEVINVKPAGSEWSDGDRGIGTKRMVVTLELSEVLADSITTNPTLYKVDDAKNPTTVLLSDRQTMVALTVDSFNKDDVVMVVRVPVYIDDDKRMMRPVLSQAIRGLRRSDSVTYNNGESKTSATHCLVVMVVPKANEAEMVKLIGYNPDVELVPGSASIEFPKLEGMKTAATDRVTNEGK